MAQKHFKATELTISIPEKAPEHLQDTHVLPTQTACGCTQITNPCLGFTFCGFSPICHIFSMCHGQSPIISPGTCTTTIIHCTPTPHVCTPTPICTISADPTIFETPNEISKVTDIETLNTLKEKLTSTLKEVEAQHAKVSKTK
jgi:hypothetical protein